MNHKDIKTYCILITLFIGIIFAGSLGTKYCQANAVNIRAEPNTNSEILGTLSLNDSIVPIDETEDWYKIDFQEQDAWVYKDFFKEERGSVGSALHFQH